MTAVSDLKTAVEARISAQALTGLTQWDDPTATSANDSRLSAACTDAVAFFRNRGVTYDNTDEHVALGVRLVKSLLVSYQGVVSAAAKEEWSEIMLMLDRIRDRAATKGSRGGTGFPAHADQAALTSRRFGPPIMDLVRKPPTNPNQL